MVSIRVWLVIGIQTGEEKDRKKLQKNNIRVSMAHLPTLFPNKHYNIYLPPSSPHYFLVQPAINIICLR